MAARSTCDACDFHLTSCDQKILFFPGFFAGFALRSICNVTHDRGSFRFGASVVLRCLKHRNDNRRKKTSSRGEKPKAVSAGGFRSALCVKAIAGPADHTVRFVRGAKPQEPRPQTFGPSGPRDDDTRGGKWRNGMWVRDVRTGVITRGRKQNCEGQQANPMDVAGILTVPARSREQPGADPVREPERSATNDRAGGVCTAHN